MDGIISTKLKGKVLNACLVSVDRGKYSKYNNWIRRVTVAGVRRMNIMITEIS